MINDTASPFMAAPLLSWDFFLEGYQRLMQKGDDLIAIDKLAKAKKWQTSWDFQQELVAKDTVIVVTNNTREIVFASQNIHNMTGYTAKELKGKNPKMFQGEKTDRTAIHYIREKIMDNKPFDAVVINYKKNGQPYNCHIKAWPVFNDQNELVNYIAFEKAA